MLYLVIHTLFISNRHIERAIFNSMLFVTIWFIWLPKKKKRAEFSSDDRSFIKLAEAKSGIVDRNLELT